MKSIASAIKLQFNETGQPEIVLKLLGSVRDIRTGVDELKTIVGQNKRLSVEIKQHREKRSLDANGYLWVMCQKISEVIRSTKEDVYKKAVRDVGQFQVLAIEQAAAEQFIKVWNSRGIGWFAEDVDSKLTGCRKIIAYYGSSVYDTREMSVLIDYIVEEAKELGIETKSPEELESIKRDWRG